MKRLAVAGMFSLLMVVALLGLMTTFQLRALAAPAEEPAAPQAVAVSIDVAPTALPADTTLDDCATGTPYAIHVTTTGLDAGLSYLIKAYHYSATDGNINRGCM